MAWDHDSLARDLAGHLKGPERMVWIDMQLGRSGSPRPDVYTINKSYAHPCPTAYECKISKSDFRADVTASKWTSYLDFAYAVVFAAPAGMLSKEEIPSMCGLIVRHENAWRYAKKPTPVPKAIDQEALLKLLIDGVHREGPAMRAKHWDGSYVTRQFAQRFGSEAARYVADAAEIHRRLEHAEAQRTMILARANTEVSDIRQRAEVAAPAMWADLLQALGLKSDATRWNVEREIRALKQAREGGEHATALRTVMNQLRRVVASNEHLTTEITEQPQG